jgi:hypothetical protein
VSIKTAELVILKGPSEYSNQYSDSVSVRSQAEEYEVERIIGRRDTPHGQQSLIHRPGDSDSDDEGIHDGNANAADLTEKYFFKDLDADLVSFMNLSAILRILGTSYFGKGGI